MSIFKKMTEPLIFQIIPVNERDADPSEYDLNRFFRSFEQEMNMVAHQAVSIDIPALQACDWAALSIYSFRLAAKIMIVQMREI